MLHKHSTRSVESFGFNKSEGPAGLTYGEVAMHGEKKLLLHPRTPLRPAVHIHPYLLSPFPCIMILTPFQTRPHLKPLSHHPHLPMAPFSDQSSSIPTPTDPNLQAMPTHPSNPNLPPTPTMNSHTPNPHEQAREMAFLK